MASLVFSAAEGVEYKVKLKGADDGGVKRAVKQSSRTITMRKRVPSTMGQLRHRIEQDVPVIEQILESRGFYDGTVAYEIVTKGDKVRIVLTIEQGPQYRFGSVDLTYANNSDEKLKIKPMVRSGQAAVAINVFAEQQRIIDQLKRQGYPFASLLSRSVEVNRETKTVDLALTFEPGTLAFFGPLQVEGVERYPSKYIQRQVPWKEGMRYDSDLVRDFETLLLGTGQFGSARVEPQQVAGTNAIPIVAVLKERDVRTIRLGVNYSDIGPGGSIYWEHRNVLGGGERFETEFTGSPILLEWSGRLIRSGFLDANQALVLELVAARETPDAYDSDMLNGTAMVIRDFTPSIQGGAGIGYNYSNVEQFSDASRYGYVVFPLQATFDYRNDRLNPVKGFQVFGRTSWFADVVNENPFLKSYLEGRQYHMWWERYRVSSALRLTLGSIDGAAVDEVPADERYYAGGGGSIRGYAYQDVGPQLDGTPTGGNKLLEFSAELRMQPGAKLGYVAFLDGGTVYNSLVSDGYDQSLSYGAGLGIRYFTGIGPLRVDLAYPLNATAEQQERLQFYISLGQSF
ncbi:BamA/TamA family outer membrane protein [Pontiellaceae bacterium B12219]|nr:BamA/TamA family outer membrane protein [Pontiellaceae bacterium B12219]